MNEQQARQAFAALLAEIPQSRRARFTELYDEWAAQAMAAGRWSQAMSSGGSTTRTVVKRLYGTNPAPRRDAAAAALKAEFPKQADRSMRIGVTTGLGEALMRDWGPILAAAAAVAAVGYSGVLSSVSAAPAAAPTVTAAPAAVPTVTVADTYAAISQAAGLTTSGNIAADISLASAVQTGAMPVAAAQSYATSIAAGEIAAESVVAGLAADYGIGIAAVAESSLLTTAAKSATSSLDVISGKAGEAAVAVGTTAATTLKTAAVNKALTPKTQPKVVVGAAAQSGGVGIGTIVVAALGLLAALWV